MNLQDAIYAIQRDGGFGIRPVPVTYSQWDNAHGWVVRVDDPNSIGLHWYVVLPDGHVYGWLYSREVPFYYPSLTTQDVEEINNLYKDN